MSKTSIYLNFAGQTEAAFRFYQTVFGTEFSAPFMYVRDIPKMEGMPEIPENELDKIMHIALPILGGTILMGTDSLECMGHQLISGNNVSINLEPDTLEETEKLFNALSAGGTEIMPLQMQFWGAMWGACVDKFGTRWMFNCETKQ